VKFFVDSARPPRYIAEFRNKVFKILELARSLGQSVYGGSAIAEHLDESVHAVLQILRTETDALCARKKESSKGRS
jgi:hypothetical protein